MVDSDNESIAGDTVSEFDMDDIDHSGPDGCDAEDDPMEGSMVIEPPEVRKAPYLIMNRAELAEAQGQKIAEAVDLLNISKEHAFILLLEYGWDLARLQEAWFDNDAKVLSKCGLSGTNAPATSSSAPPDSTGQGKCPICMCSADLVLLDCGHGFCADCWRGYLHSKVDDGKAAVKARCPSHKCGRAVPSVFFERFCEPVWQEKYKEWCLRTYVEENPSVKWCTNPAGCNLACENAGAEACDIVCNCTFVWCWACGEEAHRPAACGTVREWNIKNSAESENISWIRANTKQCPKCHKAIERNQGCNHMVCSTAGGCGHNFCWLCLGDWATHGSSTGGYYQCNIYEQRSKEGKMAEEEKGRQKAKHALDKYMFYFERFMNHDRSMKHTIKEESQIENKVHILHDKHGFEIIELQFLYDALRQVRICRRVLKWTYVYGYYLEETGPEKHLFEHLQKNLEEKTDCLHEMLERDLDQILANGEETGPGAEAVATFRNFRSHATNFTNVTQKFLNQILMDMSQGGAGLTTTCNDG
jgi:ariadne-1